MEIVLADMFENGRCVGRTPKSAVEKLLVDPCELLFPYVLTGLGLEASLSLVLASMVSRKEVSRSTNRLRHLCFPCLLWSALDDTQSQVNSSYNTTHH